MPRNRSFWEAHFVKLEQFFLSTIVPDIVSSFSSNSFLSLYLSCIEMKLRYGYNFVGTVTVKKSTTEKCLVAFFSLYLIMSIWAQVLSSKYVCITAHTHAADTRLKETQNYKICVLVVEKKANSSFGSSFSTCLKLTCSAFFLIHIFGIIKLSL